MSINSTIHANEAFHPICVTYFCFFNKYNATSKRRKRAFVQVHTMYAFIHVKHYLKVQPGK
jgi:hypothetical protein